METDHSSKIRYGTRAISKLLLALGLVVMISSCYTVPEADPAEQAAVSESYVPPSWAPPYDNVSEVRYYYFPDNEMYYDVYARQFWYQNDGVWLSSYDLPPMYADYDLSRSYVVLIDRDQDRPWNRHQYYRDNYPRHSYDNYRGIVEKNRVINNVQPNHELVPRAYNENNNKVTFMQHPTNTTPTNPNVGTGSGQTGNGYIPKRTANSAPVQQTPAHVAPPPTSYYHVAHEVPMKLIAPSMPPQSRNYNYGRGVTRTPSNGNSGNKR